MTARMQMDLPGDGPATIGCTLKITRIARNKLLKELSSEAYYLGALSSFYPTTPSTNIVLTESPVDADWRPIAETDVYHGPVLPASFRWIVEMDFIQSCWYR